MNRLLTVGVILLATLPLLAEDGDAKDSKTRYDYPLEVGSKWTYEVAGKADPVSMVAEGSKKVGKKTGVEMVTYVGKNRVAAEVMMVEQEKLYRLSLNDLALDPPLELFRFDARKGDSWKAEFSVANQKVKTEFTVSVDKVEVPAGKYRSAKIVRGEADDGTNKIISTVWYVSGVGMVKQTVLLNGQEIVDLELASFEPAKK